MRKIRANISRSKLKNGLSVATDRMPGLPVDEVFLRLLVAGGSCIESKSDSGYSHLLEHIILNGSKNFPDSRATVESAYGYIAGFTSQFDTGYDISIPKKHMELGIRILADMVQNPTVSEEQLEKEKSIIEMEQIQYPFKAHPLDIASFGEDCPLCRPIMGSRENVANATRGSLLKFMDENYSANKIALLAVGDVNHDRICETAARCFAGIKPYTPYRHSGLKFNEQSIHGINDNGALGITASFRFLNEYDTTPERYVATRIGANSIYGKITDVIREKHAMIYSVDIIFNRYIGYNLLDIHMTLKNTDIEKLLQSLNEVLGAIKGGDVGKLDYYKHMLERDHRIKWAGEGPLQRLQRLRTAFIYGASTPELDDYIRLIHKTTADDVANSVADICGKPPVIGMYGNMQNIDACKFGKVLENFSDGYER